MSFHLDKLIESERTLHQLANVFNDWILDLIVFSTDEQAYRGDKYGNLLADHTFARRELNSQGLDAIVLLSFPIDLLGNLS